jgi:sugar/nucleoside kinase (ribokinase family)
VASDYRSDVKRLDLLVLGDANPDLVLRGGEVAPAFGQAERIVDEARLVVGGSGAIAACGAARLGLRVGFCGVVGDDLFGSFMRERLAERGVDLAGLAVDPHRPTGLSVILSAPQDRAILTSIGTIGDLRGSLIDPDLLAAARHVHVSSYFLQRALWPDLPSVLEEARDGGATVSLDPNWDPSGAWDLSSILPRVDLFLPNVIEATRVARISDLDEAVARLRTVTAGVVVKAGERGAVAAVGEERAEAPALEVRAVDTTGAGDSFDAGFLAGFLAGEPLADALALANACGALSTRAVGGTEAQPTLEEARAAIGEGATA